MVMFLQQSLQIYPIWCFDLVVNTWNTLNAYIFLKHQVVLCVFCSLVEQQNEIKTLYIVWSHFIFFLGRPDLDDFVSETIDKKSSTGLITAIYDDKSKTSENSLTSDAHDHPNATKSPRPEKNDPFSLDDR